MFHLHGEVEQFVQVHPTEGELAERALLAHFRYLLLARCIVRHDCKAVRDWGAHKREGGGEAMTPHVGQNLSLLKTRTNQVTKRSTTSWKKKRRSEANDFIFAEICLLIQIGSSDPTVSRILSGELLFAPHLLPHHV